MCCNIVSRMVFNPACIRGERGTTAHSALCLRHGAKATTPLAGSEEEQIVQSSSTPIRSPCLSFFRLVVGEAMCPRPAALSLVLFVEQGSSTES